MKYSTLTVGIAVLVLGACTRTNAALMDNSLSLVRTCPDGVRIYTSPDKVGSEYQEVALLNSTGSSGFTTESGMMKSMRKKASDVGANGIIMSGIDEPSAGAKVAAALFGVAGSAERKGKSVAIYVPADAERVQAFCASQGR